MNWDIAIRIFEVAFAFALAIWVAPLRRLQEKIEAKIEKTIDEKFHDHKVRLDNHATRIRDMELGQISGHSAAKDVFMTKEDFRLQSVERGHQMDLINVKLDDQTVKLIRVQTLLEVKK